VPTGSCGRYIGLTKRNISIVKCNEPPVLRNFESTQKGDIPFRKDSLQALKNTVKALKENLSTAIDVLQL
jgi:hypothetical protein